MAQSHGLSVTVSALVLAGLVGCGGSDQNTPPKAPEPTTTNATTTTGAPTAADGTPTATPAISDSTVTAPSPPISGTAASGAGMPGTGGVGTTGTGTSGTGTPGTTEALNDEQIVAVMNAANNGEVDQAKEAVKKAKNAKVKAFAQHMITDHTNATKQQTDITKKANITAADNTLSTQIRTDGQSVLSQLQSASAGADFDKQYIEAQVKEHQTVLDNLDNKLIPNAKNADLKAMLQKVRDKVADHLKQAKDIQASLK